MQQSINQENYKKARAILRRYMADYSTGKSGPSGKGGFYALLIPSVGKVWLGESNNFPLVVSRHRATKVADNLYCNAVKAVLAKNERPEIWLLTQPERFSAQQLEDELFREDLLVDDVTRVESEKGKLWCIRHIYTNNFYVASSTQNYDQSKVLNSYLISISKRKKSGNELVDNFISTYAQDILSQNGFTIHEIGKFKNSNERHLMREEFIVNNRFGMNLNVFKR